MYILNEGSRKFRKEMQISFLAKLAVGITFRNYESSVLLLGVTTTSTSTVEYTTVKTFTEMFRTTAFYFIP